MALLKLSTAYTRAFLLIDSADHVSGKTGVTPTVTLSKAGGAFGAAGGTVTEIANGFYKIAYTTTDSNTLGDLAVHVTGTGCDATDFVDQVVAVDLADAVRFGLTALPNAAAEASGGLYTRGTGAGQINQPANGLIDANTLRWNGTAVATPATAGVPDVNVKNINNVAATSVTTINANVGTTQPVNYTGTGASALVKGDAVDIAGAAVSTSTAQIGVNAVNLGGTAQTGRDVGASVLLSAGTGTGQLDFTSGVVKANAMQFAGQTITAAAGVTLPASVASPTNITAGTITNLTNAPTSGDFTATMKTSLNSATPAVTVSDKTGFSLSAAGVQAIWDALTSALTTVGSVGKAIADNLTGNAFTRLGAPVGASISADIAGVQADTDNIQTRLPAALVSGRMDSSVGAMATDTLTSAALAASAVTEIQTGLSTLDASGVRTAVGLASANLDTQLSTIAGYIDTEVAAIKAKTDTLPASPAAVSDIPTAIQNADALLKRDFAAVTGEARRSLLNAGRKLLNKWTIVGTLWSILKEDDTTVAYTETLTTSASADPVTGSDPT